MKKKKRYTDHQLFTFTTSRQKKHFNIVYEYYSPILYGFLLNTGLSERYSLDILEMTFIKMWNHENLPEEGTSYFNWIIKIAIKSISEYLDTNGIKYKIYLKNPTAVFIQFEDLTQPLFPLLCKIS